MRKCLLDENHQYRDECPVGQNEQQDSCSSLNPDTMMPYPETLNSMECDDISLSKIREKSTIPRTNAESIRNDSTWVYPSSHMFYSALKRKGQETPAEYIDMMVTIHNQLNENAWQEILKWENSKSKSCQMGPTLYQFRGRYDTLSPKARIYTWFGVTPPFDRHDWIIDRCGKKTRYIIDYYSGHPEPDGTPTMHVDIRPDLSSLENIAARLRMTITQVREWIYDFSTRIK